MDTASGSNDSSFDESRLIHSHKLQVIGQATGPMPASGDDVDEPNPSVLSTGISCHHVPWVEILSCHTCVRSRQLCCRWRSDPSRQ